ncbi:hypothetical protein ALC60_05661 [Trachymyrmex zeteki]|uniref:Uncharacterized protein n=1 Tax=Mycetomoellerius zeteki TaxID=64791 RepID=A0A151X585_9HYME|nr:hypothetical protein ALC60_05661 [Trachymyrmex zeteki]
MSEAIERQRVFDPLYLSLLAQEFLKHKVIYRLRNWYNYVQRQIGEDVRFLVDVTINRLALDYWPWVNPYFVRRIFRAEFRILYFLHGMSTAYNFKIQQHMFGMRTEMRSIAGDRVILRPLDDESDDYEYPLYTSRIPAPELTAIKHVWAVANALYRNDPTLPIGDNEPMKYLVTLHATWAISKFFMNDIKWSHFDRFVVSVYDNYKSAFHHNVPSRVHLGGQTHYRSRDKNGHRRNSVRPHVSTSNDAVHENRGTLRIHNGTRRFRIFADALHRPTYTRLSTANDESHLFFL